MIFSANFRNFDCIIQKLNLKKIVNLQNLISEALTKQYHTRNVRHRLNLCSKLKFRKKEFVLLELVVIAVWLIIIFVSHILLFYV